MQAKPGHLKDGDLNLIRSEQHKKRLSEAMRRYNRQRKNDAKAKTIELSWRTK